MVAVFQPLSEFQQRDCLFCDAEATREAFTRHSEKSTAHIRCCGSNECGERAMKLLMPDIDFNVYGFTDLDG